MSEWCKPCLEQSNRQVVAHRILPSNMPVCESHFRQWEANGGRLPKPDCVNDPARPPQVQAQPPVAKQASDFSSTNAVAKPEENDERQGATMARPKASASDVANRRKAVQEWRDAGGGAAKAEEIGNRYGVTRTTIYYWSKQCPEDGAALAKRAAGKRKTMEASRVKQAPPNGLYIRVPATAQSVEQAWESLTPEEKLALVNRAWQELSLEEKAALLNQREAAS